MNQAIPLRPFPFHGTDVTAVVTTRHGGVSIGSYASLNLSDGVGDDHDSVLENRRRVATAVGVEQLTIADQKHTGRVAVVDKDTAGRGHEGRADSVDAFAATDALITNVPGIALAILAGDCAPIVVYDPVRNVIGVAHCGRVGAILGVIPRTLTAMSEIYGSVPTDLTVGIGPTIGLASYEIGAAEASDIVTVFEDAAAPLLIQNRPGHALFDLPAMIRLQLGIAGVLTSNVHDMATDTKTATDTFFSDRAARPCGRFAAVALLPGDDSSLRKN